MLRQIAPTIILKHVHVMISLTHTTQLPIGYNIQDAPDGFARKASFARRFILNLSPIRYAMVAQAGGPVEKIEYRMANYFGNDWHLSRATLHKELRQLVADRIRIFHAADGSGVGLTRLEARSKAVSKALERWAYTETSAGPDAVLYGYPYAMGTKGMAAFPSFFPGQARRNAVSEAWEFHSVDAWWAGCLRHRDPPIPSPSSSTSPR